jgi:hypothetical protein
MGGWGGVSLQSRPATADPFFFTMVLCSVVLNVATTKAQEGNSFFGLVIGFAIAGAAVSGGGISGGVTAWFCPLSTVRAHGCGHTGLTPTLVTRVY